MDKSLHFVTEISSNSSTVQMQIQSQIKRVQKMKKLKKGRKKFVAYFLRTRLRLASKMVGVKHFRARVKNKIHCVPLILTFFFRLNATRLDFPFSIRNRKDWVWGKSVEWIREKRFFENSTWITGSTSPRKFQNIFQFFFIEKNSTL